MGITLLYEILIKLVNSLHYIVVEFKIKRFIFYLKGFLLID